MRLVGVPAPPPARRNDWPKSGAECRAKSAAIDHDLSDRHFESKEDLVAEAIDAASRETIDRRLASSASENETDLLTLLDVYLSDAHRKHPGPGCPVAALCSEVAHGSKATKRAFTSALERLLIGMGAAGGRSSKPDRTSALFAASAAVGALVLAPATHDESLARELLSAARERLIAPPGPINCPAGLHPE